jgi:adenylate kinase
MALPARGTAPEEMDSSVPGGSQNSPKAFTAGHANHLVSPGPLPGKCAQLTATGERLRDWRRVNAWQGNAVSAGDTGSDLCEGGCMRKYVIMGIQGSGKGTHAKMLAGGFDLEHIAVGDIFRWNVQHHTKLGAQVRRTMAAGLLVGDDLVEGVVKQRLSEHDWNYGFVIDGFPRNQRQAEFFLESYDLDGVIHLDLPDSEVTRRVLARRLCAGCGMDYSLIDNSPSSDGRCDACGGELIRREDDTQEALAVRLREYHHKTNPVLDIFRRKEYVITVDTRPGKQQVQQAIRDRIGLPPSRLTAASSQADAR